MFVVNGNNAFQKVIIFEESQTLPGVETFGGIWKQHEIKKQAFPDPRSKST